MSRIPKIIHYCWFGGNKLPNKSVKYILGWKNKCPDYKIIQWSEKNFNVNKYPFTRKAYKNHNWAAISDYVRLIVLYKFGGVYLDTDVEMKKSLTPLLNNKCFLGMEDYGVINSGLIFGSQSKNSNVLNLLSLYNKIGGKNNSSDYMNDQVHVTTTYFHKLGFKYNNNKQVVNNCVIYPTDYFCPEQYNSAIINTTHNTYTIHHYFDSWSSIGLHGKKRFNFILRKYLRKILGTKLFLILYRKHMYNKKGNL